jgi:hypothetical protein
MGNSDLVLRKKGPLDEMLNSVIASVWDIEDPRSVIRIVPEHFRELMLKVPEELRVMDESALRIRAKPSPLVSQVRLMFWLEYSRSLMEGNVDPFRLVNCYRGICTSTAFEAAIKDEKKLAFILCPPVNYTARLHESLDAALGSLRKILQYKDVGPDGKLNTKLLELKFKIAVYLDARVNGPIAQKLQVENKNVNFNLDNVGEQVKHALLNGDIAAIDKRLKELEHELDGPEEVFDAMGRKKSNGIKDINTEYTIEDES